LGLFGAQREKRGDFFGAQREKRCVKITA